MRPEGDRLAPHRGRRRTLDVGEEAYGAEADDLSACM